MRTMMASVPARLDPGVDLVDFRCKYHCVKCNRHFADRKAFDLHFDHPGAFEGCHKPKDSKTHEVYCIVDGECRIWSDFAFTKDMMETPKQDVRVYASERL